MVATITGQPNLTPTPSVTSAVWSMANGRWMSEMKVILWDDPKCPECEAGKHQNCTEMMLVEGSDEEVICACSGYDHKPGVWED